MNLLNFILLHKYFKRVKNCFVKIIKNLNILNDLNLDY